MRKCVVVMMAMLNLAAASSAKTVIPVWPHLKVPPGLRKVKKEIQGSNGLVEIRPIRLPTLTEFPAPKKLRNGCAIVICPGGAYYLEAMALEGYRVARRFNRAGISCYVLRYRLPDGKLPRSGVPWPLQDVRRAIQIVKSHAKAWHINRHDVGVMGFSAGGSVASLAGVHWIPANPQSPDPVDHYSSRPRFMVLGYPVISMIPGITHPGSHNNLLGQHPALRTEQYFSSELNVDALTPPAFIFYAHDDHAVSHANEKLFYAALRRQRIPAKLVEFRHGGHGFGLGRPGTDSVKWPAMCIQWLRKMKFIPSSAELQLFRRSGHQWSRRIDG